MNKLIMDWCPAFLYVLFSFTLLQVMRTSISHKILVSTYNSLGTIFNMLLCVPTGASTSFALKIE
jgi:hypothetical protein